MADKIKFWPIQGKEKQILEQPYLDGKIYFTTDTNKIYLDVNGSKHLMGGGNSGIVYADGSEEQIKKVSEDDKDNNYIMDFSALENSAVAPQKDDLILNGDGRFFKVISVDAIEGTINVQLLAVSGTGGGGGGPVVVPQLSIVPDTATIGSSFTYISGQHYNMVLTINTTTVDDEANITIDFFSSSNVNAEPVYVINKLGVPIGEPISIDIAEMPYIGNGMTIRIIAEAANADKAVTRIFNNIRFVDMHLEKPAGAGYIKAVLESDVGGLNLSYIPYGNNLTMALHASVDGNEFNTGVTLTNQNMGSRQTLSIPTQQHGTHIIDLWATTEINGATLETEHISYEAAWIKNTETAPVIWTGPYEETVIQYENAVIPYMVYDPVQQQYGLTTEVHFYHNGIEIAASPVNVAYSSSGWLQWDVTSLYRVGQNRFTIVCGITSKDVVINITTEGSRDLGLVNESALITNFTSSGRSSSEIKTNRATWKSTVGNFSAQFENFNWYNNGWKDDNDGRGSYLSIANDSSVTIPFGNLSINNDTDYTFEIRFRVKNIQKYSTLVTQIPLYKYYDKNGRENVKGEELTLEEIEARGYTVKVDSDGNKEMEQSNPTRKIVETENGIAFKYLNGNGYGFAIGTQEAYFATAGKVVNVRYKEDEVISITFVVDKTNTTLYIYLNGILTGAADLNNVPYFLMQSVPFLINSKYCDFDLYSFRIYKVALSMPEVIHNYLSDMKDISLYDENQLTNVNDDTALDYNKLIQYNEEHPDNPTMPYAIIDMSMYDDDRLPYIKASNNTKVASITFVNPMADRLLETQQISEFEYYTHCPSFTSDNVDINVQGTSSQGYPRRNYKTKFKKAKNWNYTKGSLAGLSVMGVPYEKDGKTKYKDHTLENDVSLAKNWHMDNEKLATNKFTWKIDYMESSGSYNTGFANMMGNGLYNKHPLDDLGIDGENYRTSVYGFPLLVFHKKKDGTYTYIGRYNLNLDKSSNEYYGFEEEVEHPYVVNEDGTHPTIAEVSECWELRDNQGVWCSFKYPNEESRQAGFGTLTGDATESAPKLEAPLHFEPRYNVEADEIEAAASYTTTVDGTDYSGTIGNDNAAMCNYLRKKYANLEILFNWLDSTDTDKATNHVWTEEEGGPRRITVVSTVTGDDTVSYETIGDKTYGTFTADTKEYRRQKFKAEFNKHLDEHYCSIYFIMTELLLCYDSRGKNMMIASFGPREEGGDYIWYPIFYDIDTQLGLNNVGALLWDYNENATENKTFSTPESVLWVNFADMFGANIRSTYASLRSGGDGALLSYNTIEGAYTCNPGVFKNSIAMRGKRPIIAIGLDEYYKYLAPITQGYYDTAGTIQSGSSGNYLYACQGDRILSRELFITNRLNYMDAKWTAGDYEVEAAKQQVYMRLNVNASGTSDIYLDSNTLSELPTTARPEQELAPYPVPYFDTIPQYTATPFLNQYVVVWYDDTNRIVSSESYSPEKYPNGITVEVEPSRVDSFKTSVLQQQIVYFPAGDFLSSLGDLSTKYLDSIGIYHGKRLLDITLGSDIPGYYNDQAGSGTIFSLGDDANSNNKKTLLKKINLTGLRRLADFQDVSGSEKLQEFRALNTALPYAVFAKGAPLDTLHLPKSTTELRLAENKNLTKILKSRPVVLELDSEGKPITDTNGKPIYKSHETYEGLYLEGITDYDPTAIYEEECKLTTIQTDGDALGYGSYEILKNAVARKTGTTGSLAIQMNNVTWTPYVQVEYGESRNSDTTYYLLTDHSTYVTYTRTSFEDWENDTLNGKVYTYNADMDESAITDLSLFDQFITDYTTHAANNTINQFTNTNGSASASRPTITGELFVANTEATAIAEDELTSVYAMHWPQLTIRCAHVIESFLAKYVQIDPNTGKEIELDVIRYNPTAYNNVALSATTVSNKATPYRQYYDFKGWALEPNGELAYDATTGAWTSLADEAIFTESNNVIALYAVFSATLYTVHFFNPDGAEVASTQTTYGQPIPEPSLIPSYDPGNLGLEEVYSFKGYTREAANALPTNKSRLKTILVDLSSIAVTEDHMQVFAVYMKQNVHDEPFSSDYFAFYPAIYDEKATQASAVGDSSYNVTNGVRIEIKPGVHLQGKVTLPTYDPQGRPVVTIGTTFATVDKNSNMPWPTGSIGGGDITHIFWYEEPDQVTKPILVRKTETYALCSDDGYTSHLKYFEFPRSFRFLGSSTFFRVRSLEYLDLNDNILALGSSCLNGAFKKDITMSMIKFPGSLKYLGEYSFVGLEINIAILQFGDETAPSQLQYLGEKDFILEIPEQYVLNSSSGMVQEIYFYSSSTTQGDRFQELFNTGNIAVSTLNFRGTLAIM